MSESILKQKNLSLFGESEAKRFKTLSEHEVVKITNGTNCDI